MSVSRRPDEFSSNFPQEVIDAEIQMVRAGWGYRAIAYELNRRFPNAKTPTTKTVMGHIGKIAPHRKRVRGDYRPRTARTNDVAVHEPEPEPVQEPEPQPPLFTGLDIAFEQIVRDAFRAANNMPGIIKALDKAHSAVSDAHVAIEELRHLLGVTSDEQGS